MKAKHIYSRLKHGSSWDGYNIKYGGNFSGGGVGGAGGSVTANVFGNNEMLGVRKSPMSSSIGSRMSSLNNSHRFEWGSFFSLIHF